MSGIISRLRRILAPGRPFDGPDLGTELEKIACEADLTAEQLAPLLSDPAAWPGGCPIPADAIPFDQLLQRSGLADLFATYSHVNGMVVNYASATTIYVSPGALTHRGMSRRREGDCENQDDCPTAIDVSTILMPGECASDEGNASGLDANSWAYVYAKVDEAGSEPTFRVSVERPTNCLGYGWEHPTQKFAKFIGSIRAGASGNLVPFIRTEDGWAHWYTQGFFLDGTDRPLSTPWVELPDSEDWIPPTADQVEVAVAHWDQDDQEVGVRAWQGGGTGSPPGYAFKGRNLDINCSGTGGVIITCDAEDNPVYANFRLPVNMCGLTGGERQTIEYFARAPDFSCDISHYHEPR